MLQRRAKPYRTKAQIVADELRERIVAGELMPRQRLVLRQLADEFGCSEIPIREALSSLASKGLIELVPHGGAHVTEIDTQELIELTEVRVLIEPPATVLAARRLPAAVLPRLNAMLKQMERQLIRGNAAAYGALNREFHDMILEHCPNRRLLELVRGTRDRASRGRAVYATVPEHMKTSLSHHRRMVELIARRQYDELREVSEIHMLHVLSAVQHLSRVAKPRAERDRNRHAKAKAE